MSHVAGDYHIGQSRQEEFHYYRKDCLLSSLGVGGFWIVKRLPVEFIILGLQVDKRRLHGDRDSRDFLNSGTRRTG